VSGIIDWGDGIIETYAEILPCITLNNETPGWWSIQGHIKHSYSELGTYSFSATLTAHFTNGDISDSIKKTIVVDQ